MKKLFLLLAGVFLILNVSSQYLEDEGEDYYYMDYGYGYYYGYDDYYGYEDYVTSTTFYVLETTSTTTTFTTTTLSLEQKYIKNVGYIPESVLEKIRQERAEEAATANITGGDGEPELCGLSPYICSVEFDFNEDGRPDCCNPENNPACGLCFEKCMLDCGVRGLGLHKCLGGGEIAIVCECAKTNPACYDISHIKRVEDETPITIQAPPGGSGGYRLFFAIMFMLLVLLGVYHYQRNLD
ncbi:MAG TPA: hypothetical protein ENN13_04100 [Candidatus Altiarchaeales archaeon]|nr:hypothetical protein [Candidatus Altiarchaeales archaeon]